MEDESQDSLVGEAVWSKWVSPRKAVLMVSPHISGSEEKAIAWLQRRLDFGQLLAGAASLFYVHKGKMHEGDFCEIPTTLWPDALRISSEDDFWISGDFADTPETPFDPSLSEFSCVLTGVRFNPRQLSELIDGLSQDGLVLSNEGATDKGKVAGTRSGGRPTKPFWDQLWASVAAQLYNGDLKPTRQADIERAMHDWLALCDENAGETAVRAKAKLLWTAIQTEVEN
jgi:hypothetical protein